MIEYLMKMARLRADGKVSGWILGKVQSVFAAWSTASLPGMPQRLEIHQKAIFCGDVGM